MQREEEAAGGVEKGRDERQSRQPSSDSVRTRAPAHTARPARHCPWRTPTSRPHQLISGHGPPFCVLLSISNPPAASVSCPSFPPSHARSQPSAVTSPGPLVAAPMRSALHHHPPPFSTPWESPVSPSAAHPSTAPSPSSPTVRPATCAVPAGSVPRCRRSPHCPPHPVFQVPCHVSPSPRHPLPRRAVMLVTRNGEWRRAPRRIGAQGRRHPRRTSSPQRKPRPIPSCPASSPPEPCPLRFVPPSVVPGPRRRA